MIPDVIYLQWFDDDGEHDRWSEVTWCQDRIYETDIEYRRLTTDSTVTAAPYYMGGEAKEMILVALRAMIGRIKHDGASDWQNHMKYDMLLRQLVTMFNLAPDISPSTTPTTTCTGAGSGWCPCPPDTEEDTTP